MAKRVYTHHNLKGKGWYTCYKLKKAPRKKGRKNIIRYQKARKPRSTVRKTITSVPKATSDGWTTIAPFKK